MTDTFRLCIQNHQQAVSLTHSRRYTLFQSSIIFFGNDQLIYYYLYIVILVTVEFHTMSNFTHFTVYPNIEISFFTYLLKKLPIMSFTCTNQGSQQIDFLSFIIFQNQTENLLLGIFHHFFTGQIRISHSRTSIKQTEIIIYLSSSSYRRTRIFIRRFLFNRDHRAQTGYFINIRTLQITQKVAGIR